MSGAVDESASRVRAVALRIGTSRLDALRVRAAALRHERESLTEHMELLEEHLARLKARVCCWAEREPAPRGERSARGGARPTRRGRSFERGVGGRRELALALSSR